MASTPQPSPNLPWVLKQKGLRLLDMVLNDEGHTILTFRAPLGPVREVVITMVSNLPVEWTYGYTIKDRHSKTAATYTGRYGDPDKDDLVDIEGF